MKIAIRFGPDQMRRSVALAQAFLELSEGSEITLVTSACPELGLEGMRQTRIGSTGFPSWDMEETEAAVGAADILVLDNAPSMEMQKSMRAKARVLAVVEDEPSAGYSADCVINPNLNAHLFDYSKAKAEALLGTEFHALGPDFDEFQERPVEVAEKFRKIAVHLGADPKGELVRLAKRLKGIKGSFIATLCVGREYPHGQALASEVGLDSRFIVADDSPRRFSQSDLAIASGRTLNEMIFFRAPTLITGGGQLSEYAVRSGLCMSLPESGGEVLPPLVSDRGSRERMAARMGDLVDGLGRYRVAEELLRIHEEKTPGQ